MQNHCRIAAMVSSVNVLRGRRGGNAEKYLACDSNEDQRDDVDALKNQNVEGRGAVGITHLDEKMPRPRPPLTAAKTGTQLHPTRTTTVSWTVVQIPSVASIAKRRRPRRQHLRWVAERPAVLDGFKRVGNDSAVGDDGLAVDPLARLPVLPRSRAS